MKINKKNKKGAVNSYRFIAIYLMIGMLVGTLTLFNQDTTTTNIAYNLSTGNSITEIIETDAEIWDGSEELVKANEFLLANTYGDERALGRNWVEVFKRGLLPTGLMSHEEMEKANEGEKILNQLIIWIRWIILLFSGYELFQILIKPKVT